MPCPEQAHPSGSSDAIAGPDIRKYLLVLDGGGIGPFAGQDVARSAVIAAHAANFADSPLTEPVQTPNM